MGICELCGSNTELPLLRERIECVLREGGLTIPEFVQLNPIERIGAIIKGFNLSTGDSERRPLDLDQNFINGDYGLVVIKPEIYGSLDKVNSFLSTGLGLSIVFSENFVYNPSQYWEIYGKYYTENFKRFPHGALMFLISTSLTSRIIVFKHLDISSYHKIYQGMSRNGDIDKPVFILTEIEDRQAVFNALFVKHPIYGIRRLVCEPFVRNKGFLHMEEGKCPAVCWDFAGEFSRRGELENLITFNGIHSPKDTEELIDNFAVLSKAVKIQL